MVTADEAGRKNMNGLMAQLENIAEPLIVIGFSLDGKLACEFPATLSQAGAVAILEKMRLAILSQIPFDRPPRIATARTVPPFREAH